MAEIIPRLDELVYSRNEFAVPDGFAAAFVKLHDENWRLAQGHWERVVESVLNSTAVDRAASGAAALAQAVLGAVVVLSRPEFKQRCPLCVNASRPAVRRLADRSRA